VVDLSAFVAPFDAEAAAAVLDTDDDAEVVDRLQTLVDHSLLAVRRQRFRMLRTIRAWAARTDPVRRRAAEVRHGRWLAGWGRRQVDWSEGLQPGDIQPLVPDLIAAHRRSVSRDDRVTATLTALAASGALWNSQQRSLALDLLESVLPIAGRFRAYVTVSLASKLLGEGSVDRAEAVVDDLLADARGLDRLHGQRMRARIVGRRGHHEEALELLRQVTPALRDAGHPSFVTARYFQGEVEIRRERFTEATEHLQAAERAAYRAAPSRVPQIRYQRVVTLLLLERFREAVPPLRASIEHFDEAARHRTAAAARANLAEALRILGHHEEANELARRAAADGERLELGAVHAHGLLIATEGRHHRGQLTVDDDELARARALADALGDDNLACHAAIIEAEACATTDPDAARAACRRAATHESGAQPLLRARLCASLARLAPLPEARRAAARSDLPATPLVQAQLALARVALAHREGAVARARGALLDADRAIAELDPTDEAGIVAALHALRRQVLGGPTG